MPLDTAQSYIYQSLRRGAVLRPGYQTNAEFMADALVEWQCAYDSWNAEQTLPYDNPTYIYAVNGAGHAALASGQVLGMGYLIGPGAPDFDGPVPEKILQANVWYTETTGQPFRIGIRQVSAEQWNRIVQLQLTPINVQTVMYYERQSATQGVVWLWPPPNGNSIELLTWGVLTAPTSLMAPYAAPPAYADAIIWSLAERLVPMAMRSEIVIGKPADIMWIRGMAYKARQRVRRVNAPNPTMTNDFAGGAGHRGSDASVDTLLVGLPY